MERLKGAGGVFGEENSKKRLNGLLSHSAVVGTIAEKEIRNYMDKYDSGEVSERELGKFSLDMSLTIPHYLNRQGGDFSGMSGEDFNRRFKLPKSSRASKGCRGYPISLDAVPMSILSTKGKGR